MNTDVNQWTVSASMDTSIQLNTALDLDFDSINVWNIIGFWHRIMRG